MSSAYIQHTYRYGPSYPSLLPPSSAPSFSPGWISVRFSRTGVDVEEKMGKETQQSVHKIKPIVRDSFRHKSFAGISEEYGPFTSIGKYQINAFGVYFAMVSLSLGLIWAIIQATQTVAISLLDRVDPTRRNVDYGSKAWAWLSCALTGLLPEFTGLENSPGEPAVYVANHASWMDVPYAGIVFSPGVKYLAKSELTKVPVLGSAMRLGAHVFIEREDKRSQLDMLRQCLLILRKGTSIFIFPEGTRSPDGRLRPFKAGAFKIAVKAGVPVVPVSIAGTHIIMPKEVVMPQRSAGGIPALHVHPAIQSQGRTEKEISELVFDVLNEALPSEQKCRES